MKMEMPRLPFASRSVFAATRNVDAYVLLVINALDPLITHSSPSRTAVVRIWAASEPDWGSVSAKAHSVSPVAAGARYFCFCSSDPAIRIGMLPRDAWASMMEAREEEWRASCSMTRTSLKWSSPAPPYSSGTQTPKNPISAHCFTSAMGNSCFSSSSVTVAATTSSANFFASSWIISWSSVKKYLFISPP